MVFDAFKGKFLFDCCARDRFGASPSVNFFALLISHELVKFQQEFCDKIDTPFVLKLFKTVEIINKINNFKFQHSKMLKPKFYLEKKIITKWNDFLLIWICYEVAGICFYSLCQVVLVCKIN